MEECDCVLVHWMKCRRWEVSVSSLSWWRVFVLEANKTRTGTLFLPWIGTNPIMAVILELQWEMNSTGCWIRVTVHRNLASHSRDAVGMGATSNCGGLLSSFASSFHFPMGPSQPPASTYRCRAGSSGSAAVTETFFYMLRVISGCSGIRLCSSASQLLLCFPGFREAGGNCRDTQRGWEVARAGQRSRMEEIFSSGDHEPSQRGLGLPKKRLAALSLNLRNLRQSWIQTGTELKNSFASLDSSFGSFADPGVLINILDNVRGMDDYPYTLLIS